MSKLRAMILSLLVPFMIIAAPVALGSGVVMAQGAGISAGSCPSGTFLGIPSWHQFIQKDPSKACALVMNFPQDIWKIVLGIFDIMIRLSAYVAAGFIIWGGIRMIVSQGDPNGIKEARDTVVNAVVGLVIALLATTIVSAVAGSL